MHTWKDFLEQDKKYDSIDLHITMAEDLKKEADTFEGRVDIIDTAFNGNLFHSFIHNQFQLIFFRGDCSFGQIAD